jgi:thiol-disulfide isomerase/thioredoxin
MHVIHINSEKDADKIDQFVKKGSDVFVLVYMEGCGPCNATRPEWAKLESVLKHQYAKKDQLVIIDANKDFVSSVKSIGQIDGFPTMKYIGNHGKTVQSYEDSSIVKKDRSLDSFINWIESKINTVVSTTPTSSPHQVYKRLVKSNKHQNTRNKITRTNKKQTGGKWSTKYKRSINCRKPKGFSQKQYCKYGRGK